MIPISFSLEPFLADCKIGIELSRKDNDYSKMGGLSVTMILTFSKYFCERIKLNFGDIVLTW